LNDITSLLNKTAGHPILLLSEINLSFVPDTISSTLLSHHMPHIDPVLDLLIDQLLEDSGRIPDERLRILDSLSGHIRNQLKGKDPVRLNFICTHNSRRSQISQIWAHTAATAFQIPRIETGSGGTEATAFHPNAVRAMRTLGFRIAQPAPHENPENPLYHVSMGTGTPDLVCRSKRFEEAFPNAATFLAVMTCSDADQNCPVVPGALARIPLTYEDPKSSDGSGREQQEYLKTAVEIGREILHAFRKV
jgi:arsenate reductase (thioredoxin)